jgi:hypothetical protein
MLPCGTTEYTVTREVCRTSRTTSQASFEVVLRTRKYDQISLVDINSDVRDGKTFAATLQSSVLWKIDLLKHMLRIMVRIRTMDIRSLDIGEFVAN